MKIARRPAVLGFAVLATVLFSRVCAAQPGAPKKVATVEGITEYRLDNGLRLLLYPDASRSRVTVNMTVLVGSRHEGYGETGMAHLLEHMVFKGTPTHPNVPKALQQHGAQFNGTTSVDRTNYFETLNASDENLEFAVRLEADRLVNSSIKKEDLESEMTVVRNEFERGENSPASVLSKRIQAAAFEWHNYGKSTIGNRSDIERVPVENLRAFYRKFYQPDNVVLVVAGRFDETKALELVQKYFGAIPRPERKLDKTWTEEPEQDGERSVMLRRVGDVAAVGVAWHIPAGPHPDSASIQVLANILSTQPSGRLYKALVETKKATGVFASGRGSHDPTLMMIQAEVRDAAGADEVRDIILSTVETIGSTGVADEEVNRARQQILKAREMAANDTSQIAISLSEWAAQGDWRLYFLHRDRIEQVTSSDVKSAAAKFLQRNNRTVGMFIPTEQPQRVAIPSTPEIQLLVDSYKGREAIADGEVFDATPENIEARVRRMSLPEGIKVSLLPKKTRGEEVNLQLTLRYGNEENLKRYEAATGFLPQLMLRGTKKMSYQQLRDELDRLKATLGTGGGGGGGRGRGGRGGGGAAGPAGAISFSIETRRQSLPEVLRILQQVLREPLLPADEFDIMKRARIASMEESRTEPGAVASRLLSRTLSPYDKDNIRYVPTLEESIARVSAVTHEQVVELHRDFLGSAAGELSIVGDFDADAALPVLRETLAGWSAARPYARIATPAPENVRGSRHALRTPDKANATYLAGMVFAVRDDHPDYAALVIGNYIFGSGALSSRLGNRIRQQDGLSYSVSSALAVSSVDPRASLSMSAICNPQNIGRVEKAMQEELDRLIKDGVTDDELARAKQGYLEAQKVRRASDSAIASLLNDLSFTGRTMAHYVELERKIRALTKEEVHAAVRKHFDPARLVLITAGDFPTAAPGN